MSLHKNLIDTDIHTITAQTYADIAARDADTVWQITDNIDKTVRVEAPSPAYYVLVSVDPTVWTEFSSTGNDTLSEILANGDNTGGSDIVVDTGDVITITDAPADPTDGANRQFVLDQVGAQDTLEEILANGNTSGLNDIIMDVDQGIAVGGAARTTDTSIDLQASDQAFLGNRGTTAQKNAITAVEGMEYYDTDLNSKEYYNDVDWVPEGGGDFTGASSSLDNQLFRANGLTGKNAQMAPGAFIDDEGTLHISSPTAGLGRVSVNETAVGGNNNPGFEVLTGGTFKGGIFYNQLTDTIEIRTDEVLPAISIDTSNNVKVNAAFTVVNADIHFNSAIQHNIYPFGDLVPTDVAMEVRSAGAGALKLNTGNIGDVHIAVGGGNTGIGVAAEAAFRLKVAGLAQIADRLASRVGTDTLQIFTPTDLDPFTSGGVTTLPSGSYRFMETMTLDNKIQLEAGGFYNIDCDGAPHTEIIFTAGEPFFSGDGFERVSFFNCKFVCDGALSSLFDLKGGAVTWEKSNASMTGSGSFLGVVENSTALVLRNGTFTNFKTGLRIVNPVVVSITQMVDTPSLSFGTGPTWILEGTSAIGAYIGIQAAVVGPGASWIYIDPLWSAPVRIENVSQVGPGPFYAPAISAANITQIDGQPVVPNVVNQVLPAPFPFLGTQFFTNDVNYIYPGDSVTHWDFADPNYNGTFLVTEKDGSYGYIIESITPAATGVGLAERTTDSIQLIADPLSLQPGDHISVRDTATYNGGYSVLGLEGASIIIRNSYTGSEIGNYNDGSIRQDSKYVTATSNRDEPNSQNRAFGEMNNNVVETNVNQPDAYWYISTTGITQDPSSELWRLIDAEFGVFQYEGLHPFTGTLVAAISARKSGTVRNLRFTTSIDGAEPPFVGTLYTPMEVKTTKVQATLIKPLTDILPGQNVRIMMAVEGSTDNIIISDIAIDIKV